MRYVFLIVLLAAIAQPTAAGAEMRVVARGGFATELPRFQLGDNPEWARPEFDDRAWSTGPVEGLPLLPTRAGPFWIRARIELLPTLTGKPRDGIAVSIVAA